jgi:hypothetical protein
LSEGSIFGAPPRRPGGDSPKYLGQKEIICQR